jgi:hypothetical protein
MKGSSASAKQAEEALKRASSSSSSSSSSPPSGVISEKLAQIHQLKQQALHGKDAELLQLRQLLDDQRQELQSKESEIRRLNREHYKQQEERAPSRRRPLRVLDLVRAAILLGVVHFFFLIPRPYPIIGSNRAWHMVRVVDHNNSTNTNLIQ